MKPMLKYKIAFWCVSAPLVIPMIVIMCLVILNPFWFRKDAFNWFESFTKRVSKWRDQVSIVKYYHNKAHLFDMLKS